MNNSTTPKDGERDKIIDEVKTLIVNNTRSSWHNAEITATTIYKYFEDKLSASPQQDSIEGVKGKEEIYKNALEEIANHEGSVCMRCEGNGKLWADGQAHLPSYGGALINCGECGGSGRLFEDIQSIAGEALDSAARLQCPPVSVPLKSKEDAIEKYSFQVPYDGSNKFYNEEKAKHFGNGWDAAMEQYRNLPAVDSPVQDFQKRVNAWMMECFSMEICRDTVERNHRFLEEALELVQSLGCTQSEAHQLVDYVFGREVGEPTQEVGGVIVTLAALCLANDFDMMQCGETELARIWTKIDKIREKQAAKPKHSPLPQSFASPGQGSVEGKIIQFTEQELHDHDVEIIGKAMRELNPPKSDFNLQNI